MSTQNSEQVLHASQIVAEAGKAIPDITVAQAREELDQGKLACCLMSGNPPSGRRDIFQELSWPHATCWSGMPIRQRPLPNQHSRRSRMPASSWHAHPGGARGFRLRR